MVISWMALVALASALYVFRVPLVGARRTYRGHRIPAELPLVSGEALAVPPEQAARIAPLVADLERHGFEPVTRVGPRSPGTFGGTYADVLIHPAEQTLAWVIDMQGPSASTTYVELNSEYHDGSAVVTLNHDNPSIFESPPMVHRTLVRGGTVDELLTVHRAESAGITEADALRPPADPLDAAQRQNRRVLDHQVGRGLLRHSDGGYAFTRRGALRSAVRLWLDGAGRARPRSAPS